MVFPFEQLSYMIHIVATNVITKEICKGSGYADQCFTLNDKAARYTVARGEVYHIQRGVWCFILNN